MFASKFNPIQLTDLFKFGSAAFINTHKYMICRRDKELIEI